MTKTVTLLRHLKSDWDDPSLRDFDRPLAPRGRAAGLLIAPALAQECPKPDLILCSPARRTHETLNYILHELPEAPATFDDRIYEATVDRLKTILSDLPDTLHNILLIGHNPAMLDLAWDLANTPDRELSIYRKYPTGGVASYELGINAWKEILDAKGHALALFTPKTLKKQI